MAKSQINLVSFLHKSKIFPYWYHSVNVICQQTVLNWLESICYEILLWAGCKGGKEYVMFLILKYHKCAVMRNSR